MPRDHAGPAPGARPARTSHRLFFALVPSEPVRDAIAQAARRLDERLHPMGRWIKPHRYHLTLPYLGEHATLPEALVSAAIDAGENASVGAFDFALDRAGSFANPRIPWWLGCNAMPAGLAALWAALSTRLRSGGWREPGAQERIAHVTILRDADRRLPSTRIAPIAWRVDAFALIDSRQSRDPRHDIIRRWDLEP
jgi:RNA 2',3'-cyclic 3'-phosphodiesterase